MLDDSGIERWQSWIETIGGDLRNLYQSRRLFREVTNLIQHNNAQLLRGPLWLWMASNWVWSAAMGVRRQTDIDPDVVSMARLIEDIADHTERLTRAWFVERWVTNAPNAFVAGGAHAFFDQYAPDGAPHVQADRIRRDGTYLREDAERVRTIVNRRFAHASLREAPDDVTLGEVDHALNMIGERYRVYARLLTHQWTVDLESPLPRDWDLPFVMALERSPYAAPSE